MTHVLYLYGLDVHVYFAVFQDYTFLYTNINVIYIIIGMPFDTVAN